MVLQDRNCKKCAKQYLDLGDKWCKSCLINDLKTRWTSGNEVIDNLIQEIQLKIHYDDIVFEWISYSQFTNIKKINEDGSFKLYSAIWKDGPLHYNMNENKYTRNWKNR